MDHWLEFAVGSDGAGNDLRDRRFGARRVAPCEPDEGRSRLENVEDGHPKAVQRLPRRRKDDGSPNRCRAISDRTTDRSMKRRIRRNGFSDTSVGRLVSAGPARPPRGMFGSVKRPPAAPSGPRSSTGPFSRSRHPRRLNNPGPDPFRRVPRRVIGFSQQSEKFRLLRKNPIRRRKGRRIQGNDHRPANLSQSHRDFDRRPESV